MAVAIAASGILVGSTKSQAVEDFEIVDFGEVSVFAFDEADDEILVGETFLEIEPAETVSDEGIDMHFFEALAAGEYDEALDATVVYFEVETTGNPEDDIVLNGILSDAIKGIISSGFAIAKDFTNYSFEVSQGYKNLRSRNASAKEYVDYSFEIAENYAIKGVDSASVIGFVSPVVDLIKKIASFI
jgi:hypothetical protein